MHKVPFGPLVAGGEARESARRSVSPENDSLPRLLQGSVTPVSQTPWATPSARNATNLLDQLFQKKPLSDGPTFQKCWSFGHQSSPLTPRALPLGRHTERTRHPYAHSSAPKPGRRAPTGLASQNSFYWYECRLKLDTLCDFF